MLSALRGRGGEELLRQDIYGNGQADGRMQRKLFHVQGLRQMSGWILLGQKAYSAKFRSAAVPCSVLKEKMFYSA